MLRIAIIGAGKMAQTMITDIKKESKKVEVVAITSSKLADAQKIATEHAINFAYDDTIEMLKNDAVDAIYLAIPHRYHAEWAIKALEYQKHVLVEKPLAMNYDEALVVINRAKKNNLLVMEAFKFKLWEQTDKITDVIKSGVLGKICMVTSSFCYNNPTSPRKNNFTNGGGSILDVGCYPISFIRYIAGASMGQPFANPIETKAMATFADNGVDLYAQAILHFDNDIIAYCSSGMAMTSENHSVIYGSKGHLIVQNPWHPTPHTATSIMRLCIDGTQEQLIITNNNQSLFATEVDYFADLINKGMVESPILSYDDSLGNIQSLDAWRAQVGLSYPFE